MPYIPFTDEQKQLANSVDLAEYLRVRGEKLERAGIEHKLIYCDSSGKHDSITIRGSKWFDHKSGWRRSNKVYAGVLWYGLSDCGTGTVGTEGNSAVPQSAESIGKGRKERVQTSRDKHKYA